MTLKAVIGLVRASALSAALFLAGGAIPFVGVIVMIFTPAPIIGHVVGRPAAIWRTIGAVVLAAIAVMVAGGPSGLLVYTVTFGLATAIICYMLERGARFELIVAVATTAVLASGSAALLIAAGSPGALAGAFHDNLSAALARTEDMYKVLGVGPSIDADSHSKLVEMIVRLSPALAGITTALAVLANLSVFWRSAGRSQAARTSCSVTWCDGPRRNGSSGC